MHVHLHDARTLRITHMGHNYNTLSALPGATYDKPTKSLLVPLCHLRRVWQLRPVVIDHACVAARLDMWRRWVQQHNACGVWFAYADDGRTVVPTSDDGELSPCFVEHVASRSDVLAQFLGDQVLPAATPASVRTVEPTRGDELIWNGMQNASRKQEENEGKDKRRKARHKKQYRQAPLGIGE